MDEIEKRLRDTSDTCFTCYEAWLKNKKDPGAREALLEAVHEVRKVASRLEIELAVSERDEMTQRPIPIPPHRDAQRRPAQEMSDDNAGNRAPPEDRGPGGGDNNRPHQHRSGGQHRRSGGRPHRKSAEG